MVTYVRVFFDDNKNCWFLCSFILYSMIQILYRVSVFRVPYNLHIELQIQFTWHTHSCEFFSYLILNNLQFQFSNFFNSSTTFDIINENVNWIFFLLCIVFEVLQTLDWCIFGRNLAKSNPVKSLWNVYSRNRFRVSKLCLCRQLQPITL